MTQGTLDIVLDVNRTRRSVARLKPDPVERALIERCLEAPVVVAITSVLAEDPERREEDLWATIGAAYAFMLGLWSAGVGSYLRTGAILEHPSLRALLAVPADRRVTGIIYAGYPAELPTKRRTPAAERTVWLR